MNPLHHPARHRAHPTHIRDQPNQMKTTRYRVGVGVLVQILHFLIVIRLSQKVLGKNTTGYLDIGHRDLRSKVEIQGKVEIPVVIRMPLVAMLQTLLGRVQNAATDSCLRTKAELSGHLAIMDTPFLQSAVEVTVNKNSLKLSIPVILVIFFYVKVSNFLQTGLHDFLRFTTGVAMLPMTGSVLDNITVTFDAVDDCIFSSTCLLTLQIPPKFESYKLFKAVMEAAISNVKGPAFNVV